MTVAGEAALREELERLKKVDRPRIVAAIAEAREHGDLKENATLVVKKLLLANCGSATAGPNGRTRTSLFPKPRQKLPP